MAGSLVSKYSGSQLSLQVNGVDKLLINSDGSLVASASPNTGDRSLSLATMQKFADEFGVSLSANGYQKLPSGLIIQWGVNNGSTSGAATYSFPIAFPSAAIQIVASLNKNAGSARGAGEIVSKSQFSVSALSGATYYADRVSWVAFGY